MKVRTVLAAAMALSMTLGQCALAQGNGRGPQGWQNDGQRNDRDFDHRDPRGRGPGGYGPPGHYDDRRDRGAGPNHNFHRGDRLAYEYRSRTYVVDDWRGHRLSAPPRGYHWVQTGSDYVLVAIATGIIAQILLSQ